MILEIDPLTTDIAVRRKRFYERLGFMLNPFPHVHPPYHDGLTGHALLVLSRPRRWRKTFIRPSRSICAP